MEIFLGISILVLLVIIYFAFLKNQNLNTGGVKKYDIQMLFSAMMWNTFWFGLLYYIIGPEKMWELWFVLIFMVILSLFQYIWKWDYAWALYLSCFFFLIIYFKGNDIKNSLKNDTTKTNNQNISQRPRSEYLYFGNSKIIEKDLTPPFKFYPKGGCVLYTAPGEQPKEDCPGVDNYYPKKFGTNKYIFEKINDNTTAVEIVYY